MANVGTQLFTLDWIFVKHDRWWDNIIDRKITDAPQPQFELGTALSGQWRQRLETELF